MNNLHSPILDGREKSGNSIVDIGLICLLSLQYSYSICFSLFLPPSHFIAPSGFVAAQLIALLGKGKTQREWLLIACCRGRSCTYPAWVASTLVRSRTLGRRKALPLRRFPMFQQRDELRSYEV